MASILSRSERETLKAIYRLAGPAGATAGAHTGDLAHALGVSPGTTTATIKRLADRGLVEHKPYRGVLLTRDGRRAAVAAIRRHRIAERFLSDMLGYPWSEADRLATTFEHELPQEVEERLYVALHRPTTCPHGFPIPEPAEADIPDMPPLYDLQPGDVAVVAVPGATDDEVVAFLDTLGLRPGVRVQVKEKHPFDGPLVLVVDGHQRTVGEKVARQVHVRKDRVGPQSPVTEGPVQTRTEQRFDEQPDRR
ncbi:MAG: metal-dependent transcriptional regulator [Actinomycetota bacterium]|nr:metal-dependent transcriptional regulator [Actinomycetota bacterium]